MGQYEKFYGRIYNWFTAGKSAGHKLSLLRFLYRYVPYVIAAVYIIMLAVVLFVKNDMEAFLRIVLVPFLSFVTVTLLRKVIDCPRPYARFNVKPLIPKNKTGESFPSRHTFSAAIIAMAGLYINGAAGIFLWILTVIVAVTRVLGGVHFVRDVAGAVLLAIIAGILGFS